MAFTRMLVTIALAALVCSVAGQYDYQKKGYVPPILTGATTCTKAATGNTPGICPGAVPLTDEGKPGSTQCVTSIANGKSYEGVISLMYPAPNAVPWCTSDSQCGTTPGVICAYAGPTNSGNMCFPLGPSGCPYPSADKVNSTTTAAAGRRLLA